MTSLEERFNTILDDISNGILKYVSKEDLYSLREFGIGLMFGSIMYSLGIEWISDNKKICQKKRLLVLYCVIFSIAICYYERSYWFKKYSLNYTNFKEESSEDDDILYCYKVFMGAIVGSLILPPTIGFLLGFFIEIIILKISGYSIINDSISILID